ncbi:MAG: HAMP domain-containing histidine kinase [Actinobacteria bacterium]|nr:HAMP domain-containing histidine kinase [Actinomycetota bacterium]MCL5888015.1 HAMP domain-containing histidine kinase [Actinomycetota bacterium]
MHRFTLRVRLLAVSVLFSLLTLGGILLLTYTIVYDGMTRVAETGFQQMAHGLTGTVELHLRLFAEEAAELDPSAASHAELALYLERVRIGEAVPEVRVALYDQNLDLVWENTATEVEGLEQSRAPAMRGSSIEFLTLTEEAPLRGLLTQAILPVYVAHVPIEMPDGSRGVLDIVSYSTREEQIIDAIRPPMSVLALVSIITMILIMQYSMAWVLRLVKNLRIAADAIDTGKLDVRLPEEGDHEITALARSLNSLLDRLQRKSEAQSRFIADASHELATPVAGIRGYTSILREWGHSDPDVQAEAIAAIDRESGRMARLSKDLLALVRDERTLRISNVRFDLNARCREILAAAATRYMSKGLEFVGPDEGRLMMVGDPDRIEDAISILLDNAAKYTQKGTVSLQTRCKRGAIVIEVSDTGIGISEEDIPSIFERFYRTDISRSQGSGGFGLGLPIAKTIIDGLGGTIEVKSTLGVGSVFILRLPRGRV